jgi:hypothetical protein
MAKLNGKYLNDVQDDLSEELQLEFMAVKESYTRHKAVQAQFEAKLAEYLGVPEGKKLVCSYRFGKLGLSIEEAKPVAQPKPKQSLSDWLAQQH